MMTWLLIKKNTPYAHRILVVHFEERGQVWIRRNGYRREIDGRNNTFSGYLISGKV